MVDYKAPVEKMTELSVEGTLDIDRLATRNDPVLAALARAGLPGLPAGGTLEVRGDLPRLGVEGRFEAGTLVLEAIELALPGTRLEAAGPAKADGGLALTCFAWTPEAKKVDLYRIGGTLDEPTVTPGDKIRDLGRPATRLLLRREYAPLRTLFYARHPRFDK